MPSFLLPGLISGDGLTVLIIFEYEKELTSSSGLSYRVWHAG